MIPQETRDQYESLQNQVALYQDKINAAKSARSAVIEKIKDLTEKEGVFVGCFSCFGEKIIIPIDEISDIEEKFNPLLGECIYFSEQDARQKRLGEKKKEAEELENEEVAEESQPIEESSEVVEELETGEDIDVPTNEEEVVA